MSGKNVVRVFSGMDTQDGAGVRLRRMFGGNSSAAITDPFLLLDQFGSTDPAEYINGFPWHPHRGIETVTYLLHGKVTHEDSVGNRGTIYPSDIHWMSAASGIFHQEMPEGLDPMVKEEVLKISGSPSEVSGLQLWINMPASSKMDTPTYRDIKGSRVPKFEESDGTEVKIVFGKYGDAENVLGSGSYVDATYLDVSMVPDSDFSFHTRDGYTAILQGIGGDGSVTGSGSLYPGASFLFSREGDSVSLKSGEKGFRFILMAGRPLNEPIWWRGPIVMDSEDRLKRAFLDLNEGTFIRDRNPIFIE